MIFSLNCWLRSRLTQLKLWLLRVNVAAITHKYPFKLIKIKGSIAVGVPPIKPKPHMAWLRLVGPQTYSVESLGRDSVIVLKVVECSANRTSKSLLPVKLFLLVA